MLLFIIGKRRNSMILNESLDYIKKDNYIEYYSGTKKELYADDLNALWEFLLILKKERLDERDKLISRWKTNYNYTDEDIENIISYLKIERILIEDMGIKNSDEQRYLNYFNTFENGDFIYKELKTSNVLIIGLGTIGSSLAAILSKFNIHNIIVVDNDCVSDHNISSQFTFDKDDIGELKVEVVKNKISKSGSRTKVISVSQYVDAENVSDIESLISEYNIDCVFSCFDGATEDIHIKIFNYCINNNIPYIINGYTANSVNSFFIYEDINELKSLFSKKYEYITNNKGLITHSILNSVLSFQHYVSYKLKGQSTYRRSYSTNLFIRNEDKFIKIQEIDENIEYFNSYLQLHNHYKNNEPLKNMLVSLYRENILAYKLGVQAKEEFFNREEKILNIMDFFKEEKEDLLVSAISSYDELKENLLVRDEDLLKLNELNSDIQKSEAQKKIYDELYSHGNELLNSISKIKKLYCSSDSSEMDYFVEHGIEFTKIFDFSNGIFNEYEKMTKKVLNLLFPNTDIYDYLFKKNKVKKINMNLNEYTELILDIISNETTNIYYKQLQDNINELNEDKHIIKDNTDTSTTIYIPEKNKSVVFVNIIDNPRDIIILSHEIGHSFINKFYGKQFYKKSNTLLNEIFAHFTEILLTSLLLEKSNFQKEELQFQYLYRINQYLISSYASFISENNFMKYMEHNNYINVDEFIKLHKKEQEIIPNIRFKNSDFSKLNILIYDPFSTGYYETILQTISFSLAIHIYETYKDNLDYFYLKIDSLFSQELINIDGICIELFGHPFEDKLYKDVIESINIHLDRFYIDV